MTIPLAADGLSEAAGSGAARDRPGKNRRAGRVAAALLALHASLLAWSAEATSVTIDEYWHLPAALHYWTFADFSAYHFNPPLSRWWFGWPCVLAGVVVPDLPTRDHITGHGYDDDLGQAFYTLAGPGYEFAYRLARSAAIISSVACGWLIWTWSRELWGAGGGLVSLTLWCLSPWALGHGMLVTPDVPCALTFTAAVFAFVKYAQAPEWRSALRAGLFLGLALATKFTATALGPVWLAAGAAAIMGRGWPGRLGRWVGHSCLVLAASLCVLNTTYLWQDVGRPLGEFAFQSHSLTLPGEFGWRMNRFAGTWLANVPAPAPKEFLRGFDAQLVDVQVFGPEKVLHSEVRRGNAPGWWYYYLVGMAVKAPLGAIALFAFALLFWRRTWRGRAFEWPAAAAVLVVMFALARHPLMNSHVRYVIGILPLLLIGMGRVGAAAAGSIPLRVLVVLCLVVNALSVLRVQPWSFTYFNELAGGAERGYEWLGDSNIDWGQGLKPLARWLRANAPGETVHLAYFGKLDPAKEGAPYKVLDTRYAEPGLHVVGATALSGLTIAMRDPTGRERHVGVRGKSCFCYRRLQPIAIVGGCMHIFRIDAEQAREIRRDFYARLGWEYGLPATPPEDASDRRPP